MKIIIESAEGTVRLGEKFARTLKAGEVVLLDGGLGSGKTTFVKGMAAGIGITKNITSPTFVIMKVYNLKQTSRGLKHFVHIDMYRAGAGALKDIGAFEFFGRNDTICVVEWGAALSGYLKKLGISARKIKIKVFQKNFRQFDIN